jgi:hypothetical protein
MKPRIEKKLSKQLLQIIGTFRPSPEWVEGYAARSGADIPSLGEIRFDPSISLFSFFEGQFRQAYVQEDTVLPFKKRLSSKRVLKLAKIAVTQAKRDYECHLNFVQLMTDLERSLETGLGVLQHWSSQCGLDAIDDPSDMDETEYLLSSPANAQRLRESIRLLNK